MNTKIEDLLNVAKINELIHKKELEEKNKNYLMVTLAVIGAVAAVAGIAFAVYKFFSRDCFEDFEPSDYIDDFDDDFIEFDDNGEPITED